MIKVIVDVPSHVTFRPSAVKRATKMVETMLENGQGIRSATGQTMAIAVDWFERNRRGYRITAVPGAGYYIEAHSLAGGSD